MCHKINVIQATSIFKVDNTDELHDLKQILKVQFNDLFEQHNLGSNPDLAWCGEVNNKFLCWKAVRDRSIQICTDLLISQI